MPQCRGNGFSLPDSLSSLGCHQEVAEVGSQKAIVYTPQVIVRRYGHQKLLKFVIDTGCLKGDFGCIDE
jgi:hypothetical protein